ncbi:hypothetical protein GLAREA_11852 [Glarea lozoyensis ATCC 20868]|uniref:Uncharacterized protein n=1 Tax=Glarea lozoyensis (strain ATCC 20868 / MF5171) TaxID=1116229 RepID=S3D1V6_GLAL2|nr:uncharacterized protein GLAREA_11852 [Glarea lozoyensis ATCC 20868]EPE31770.1 hypothetical protein GLAREA_11852 [Glarea lozoyensis ATCC 20868]
MARNKNRVYVALYFRNYITSDPRLVQQYGLAAYHWAIFVEAKGGQPSNCFDVKEDDAFPAQGIAGGWAYHTRYGVKQSGSMLAKIMIGKLPPNIDEHGVGDMLSPKNLPLPLYNPQPDPELCQLG